MNSLKHLPKDIQSYFIITYDRQIFSIPQHLAPLIGVDQETIHALIDDLDNGQSPHEIFEGFTKLSIKEKKPYIPYDLAIKMLTYYYNNGIFTENGCKVLDLPIPRKRLQPQKPEKRLQIKLAKELKGVTEVPTEAGRIDILTSTEVIEVKQISQWKSALGQVLVYGEYYPSHKKRIYLFGVNACHSSYLDVIKKCCEKFNVAVTIDLSFES